MKKLATLACAAAALFWAPQIAHAVDIVNEDDSTYVVMIMENGEETGITVSAGESYTDVCQSCTLTIGDSEPVEAEGDELVIVKNGLLSKRSG